MTGKNTDSSNQVAPPSPVQRIAALKWRIQLLGTGVKAVRTAQAVVKRIKDELEKEHSICDDDTLKYLEKMMEEENNLRDTLVKLSGELDSEEHQVEAEISKLEDKMTELEVEIMKRNSNLGMQLKELKEDQVEHAKKNSKLELELNELYGDKMELEKRNSDLGMQLKELEEDQVEHVKKNSKLELAFKELCGEKLELEERNSNLEMQVNEIKEDRVEHLKKNSKLELELKELYGVKLELEKRNSDLEMQVNEIKEEKVELEREFKKQVKHMKSEESRRKKESRRILDKDQKKTLLKDVSPLQNLVDRLPNTMKTVLAPKGSLTGDEFGAFMGGFINMAAFTVTSANQKMGITAMSALASLMSLMISTMFNNIVTYILTVQNDQPSVAKAFTSLPWIMLGGALPIAVGGFIPHWGIRAIVTGAVTFVLKMALAVFLVLSYKVPKKYGAYFVILGMVGMAIAAGFPVFLEWIVKRSVKKASPSI